MKPVTVGRYKPGERMPGDAHLVTGGSADVAFGGEPGVSSVWLGWVETEDWILFESSDGTVCVFNGRQPGSGAVIGAPTTLDRVA